MNRRTLALASLPIAGLIALPLALGSAPVARADDAPADRWTTSGRWILDGDGRVVITHGVNEVFKFDPFTPESDGFGEDDAQFLQDHGFTSVRLGVPWAGVEPKPGQYDDAFLDSIERTVRVLADHGVASVLDFHQDMVNPKFQGNGWPDWAVLDHGMPNIIKAGFPGNYFMSEGVKYSYDSFYDNAKASDGIGIAEHYAGAWKHVAQRFGSVPGVVGYDLFNEPFPGHGYSLCLTQGGCRTADARLSAVQQKSVDAIRSVDPRTTIWYEPQQFFNIGVGTNVRLKGTNLGLSFHDYCVNQATTRSYFGCAEPDARVFANAEAHSKATGAGLLLTEYGAITVPAVINAQTDLAMKNRVGVQWWAYTGTDPTTAGPGNQQALVYDAHKAPTGENVDWAKMDLLAVMHPDRVAGTPTSYGNDAARRTFTMAWTAARPNGGSATPADETTVIVPERLRTKGYTVKATGATVTSQPGDRTVRLHLEPGAPSATVAVTVG